MANVCIWRANKMYLFALFTSGLCDPNCHNSNLIYLLGFDGKFWFCPCFSIKFYFIGDATHKNPVMPTVWYLGMQSSFNICPCFSIKFYCGCKMSHTKKNPAMPAVWYLGIESSFNICPCFSIKFYWGCKMSHTKKISQQFGCAGPIHW